MRVRSEDLDEEGTEDEAGEEGSSTSIGGEISSSISIRPDSGAELVPFRPAGRVSPRSGTLWVSISESRRAVRLGGGISTGLELGSGLRLEAGPCNPGIDCRLSCSAIVG